MGEDQRTIQDLVDDVGTLAAHLGGLAPDERVRQVRSLKKHDQARLFEAAHGALSIGLADLVPDGRAPLEEVVHAGRNSLPVFSIFEKRCCRPPEGDVLWGYNEHAARWMTGPGYFVVRSGDPGEVVFDYTEVPPDKPASWPAIRTNDSLRARFVYGGMHDVLRGVGAGVSIGRAFRKDGPMDNWFVLCRVDP